MLSNGVAAAAADVVATWSDEEKDFPRKKRMRGCYRARATRSRVPQQGENGAAEVVQPESSKTRRSPTASSAAMVATASAAATSLITTGSVCGGAPAPAAAKKCDHLVVREEGGHVIRAVGAAVVDCIRGCGNGKKRRSPAVLMEGSRCSRVNGRGWRCCQQTLVGYSLCEHHLGKGRLRSVARCNGRERKKEEAEDGAAPPLPSPVMQQLLWGNGKDEEDQNPCKLRKKKIATVKARSISSLLHRPNFSTPAAMASPSSPSPTPEATGTATAITTPRDGHCTVA